MFKLTITFVAAILMGFAATAQLGVTNTGINSGTLGAFGSYYGFESGKSMLSSGQYNSFFGAYSGKSTSSGDYNVGIGYSSLHNNTTGQYNIGIGSNALRSNTTASNNSALGHYSMYYNTTGTLNVAIGSYALTNNSTGSNNAAVGSSSLYSNTTGQYNIGIGSNALRTNTTASNNSALGYNAMYYNTTGSNNVGIGSNALRSNTSGRDNVTGGTDAMYSNTTGRYNVAFGSSSLRKNTTAYNNSALGHYSMYNNTTGQLNVGVGSYALTSNSTGGYNSVLGSYSMYSNTTGTYNVGIGYRSGYNVTIGSHNTFLGSHADKVSGASNATAIGYNTKTTASNQVRIGNSSVTSIGGQVSWSTLSDGRFKENIKEDVSGLAFINELRPVSYNVDQQAIRRFLKIEEDREVAQADVVDNARQTGFIAQEVHNTVEETGYAFSGVVAPQNENDYYTIRYAEFVVPLVKAVQELSAKVEAQEALINSLMQQGGGELEGEVEKGSLLQEGVELLQNAPNPFNAETKISMKVPPSATTATIKVYDLKGGEIKSIEVRQRGVVEVTISRNELEPGMYIYALLVDNGFVSSKKMIITK